MNERPRISKIAGGLPLVALTVLAIGLATAGARPEGLATYGPGAAKAGAHAPVAMATAQPTGAPSMNPQAVVPSSAPQPSSPPAKAPAVRPVLGSSPTVKPAPTPRPISHAPSAPAPVAPAPAPTTVPTPAPTPVPAPASRSFTVVLNGTTYHVAGTSWSITFTGTTANLSATWAGYSTLTYSIAETDGSFGTTDAGTVVNHGWTSNGSVSGPAVWTISLSVA